MTQPTAGGPHSEVNASITAHSISGIASTGANAINSILQLAELPGPDAVDAPQGTHNLPTPAAGMFVGRNDALTDLEVRLASGPGLIGQAVHGLGGVGKTELALRYARRHLSEYRLVWWISAETSDLLTDGVAELARRLTSASALVDGYRWAVSWLQCHDGWLLVLDNVEDLAIVRNLLGAIGGHGRVLVTTRRNLAAPVWGRLGLVPLRLGVLDRAASVELLVGLTGRVEEEAEAGLLAGELGDLPLALEQAGAFIAQEGWTLAAYQQELAGRPGDTYAATAEGFDAQRAVDRVWVVTMNRVLERAPSAGRVMSVLAYMAAEPLPTIVLTGDDESAATEEALRALGSYSMLSRAAGMVEVHRLVQAITRAHDPDGAEHRQLGASLLAQAVPPYPSLNVADWPMWNQLLPHIDTLNNNTPADERSAELLYVLNEAGTYRQSQGQLAAATELFEQIGADSLRLLGADHPNTLSSRNNLAGAYESAGRLTEAVALFEQVVTDRLRVLGPDHPNTLAARNNLAAAYQSAGRLVEAVALFEQLVTDRLRVLGPDHADSLASRHNLAFVYDAADRLAEAIPLYEAVLGDQERLLGPDHPNTLTSRNNLAGAYESAGRVAEAIPLYQQVAADRLRVLGPDHPNTLTSRNNVAYAYQTAGRVFEAIQLYHVVAADRSRVLGPDHPHTLASFNNLAGAYQTAGRVAEAISMFEQVVADSLRVLGPDHPDTLTSRHNLAGALYLTGQLAEAISLFEQVASDRLRTLGPDHPHTLISGRVLASVYQATDRRTSGSPRNGESN